jgi:putative hydrolase of the HAD superfamily
MGVNAADLSLKGLALILDFGSVVSYSVFERHAETEARLGMEPGAIQWWGPIDPAADPLWCDMLADKLTEREYWATLARDVGGRLGEAWTPADFLRAARSPDLNDEIRPEIVDLVRRAKQHGAGLAILSNELELFYGAEALADIRLLDEFDVIVDATHTEILKPDPRAYELVLEKLGVPAAAAVFLDDQPRNVAGGEAVGLAAMLFDVTDPVGSCDRAWAALCDLACSGSAATVVRRIPK